MRPPSESLLDTIAALATPAGRSALAVVRVSGEKTLEILSRLAPELPRPPTERHPHLATLVDARGEAIDRGLVTFFRAPASATGEDVAELSIHGSPPVARRLLEALSAAGARPARPGEFTERGFLLGKIDLLEAESVRDLIEARTDAASRAAVRRLEGKLSETLSSLRRDLLEAAASLAATIDFSEDVGESVPRGTLGCLEAAGETLARLSASYETGRLFSAGWRLAILGPPNAGKSTLFNALLGASRAIVTDVPGTTRDTLEATIDVAGVPVEVIDTAGLRETEDVVEKIGVERARAAGRMADAVLYTFDVSAGWAPEDAAALRSLDGKTVLAIANKIDRLEGEIANLPPGAIPFSAIAPDAGRGIRALLEQTLSARVQTDVTSDILSTARERDLVDRAKSAVAATCESLRRGEPPEYAASCLDVALAALADLFGETTSEDVLQRIFETFCIGK